MEVKRSRASASLMIMLRWSGSTDGEKRTGRRSGSGRTRNTGAGDIEKSGTVADGVGSLLEDACDTGDDAGDGPNCETEDETIDDNKTEVDCDASGEGDDEEDDERDGNVEEETHGDDRREADVDADELQLDERKRRGIVTTSRVGSHVGMSDRRDTGGFFLLLGGSARMARSAHTTTCHDSTAARAGVRGETSASWEYSLKGQSSLPL